MQTTVDVCETDRDQLIAIGPAEDAAAFYRFLDRPGWFKRHMKPLFDAHRTQNKGRIFMMLRNSAVVGCVYAELTPNHFSYGKQVPIFGWLQAVSPSVVAHSLGEVESWAMFHGANKIRGLINLPTLLGGWGAMTEGFERHLLVNSAWNAPELAGWIADAGLIPECDYVSTEVTEPLYLEPPFPNIEIVAYPVNDLFADNALVAQIHEFVKNNFSSFLPDTSGPGHMGELFEYIAQIDHGEDFYALAIDTEKHKIAAAMLQMPNIFDLWEGRPLQMADINTVIVDKDYRGKDFFHWAFTPLVLKLRKRGVMSQTGVAVWTKNKQGMYTFLRVAKIVARFTVFEKLLNSHENETGVQP